MSMRKFYLILAECLMFSMVAKTQVIEHSYSWNNPIIKDISGYSSLFLAGCQIAGEAGAPGLPYQAVKLLLPPAHEADSMEVEYSQPFEIHLASSILPMQHAKPYSLAGNSKWLQNEKIYSSSKPYPNSKQGKLSTHFFKGLSIALSTLTPVEYFPKEQKVIVYQHAKVKIFCHETHKARKALENLYPVSFSDKDLKNLIQNASEIHQYASDKKLNNPYDLLILTKESFTEYFFPLASLYEQNGIAVRIDTLENVLTNTAGQDDQKKIRNFIIAQYQQNGISYVLLGGDVEIFPARGFYCKVFSSSIYEDNNIPSDLYYSALDGTWNDDGDDLWGEIGEDDLLPEVAVARLPFSTTTELQNMLHKIISYQSNPIPNELEKPLMAGELLYNNPLTFGEDYLKQLIGYHEDNGYITNGIPEYQEIDSLYESHLGYWSKYDLLQKINTGKSFIHHAGHANWDYAMKLSSSDINNQNFSQVNGIDHNYTLVYTHGCICGAFDYSDCIAEEMLKIENFAVAGAFNSRYGWFNEGQTEGPSLHLHREFVNALYTEGYDRIGATHQYSRIKTAPWVNAPGQWEEGALRWCFYDCNILGDPAMKIWTSNLTSIPYARNNSNNFNIVYSPVNQFIEITSEESSSFQLQLIDFTGRIILTKDNRNQKNIKLDTQTVKNGLYLLHINSNSFHLTKKILIYNL